MKGFSSQEAPAYDLVEKQSLTLDSLVVMAECNAMVAGLHFRNQAYVKGTAAILLVSISNATTLPHTTSSPTSPIRPSLL